MMATQAKCSCCDEIFPLTDGKCYWCSNDMCQDYCQEKKWRMGTWTKREQFELPLDDVRLEPKPKKKRKHKFHA